jgi:hypothetical protein
MARPHHFRLLAWAAAAAVLEVPRFRLDTEPPLRSDLNKPSATTVYWNHRVDGADGLWYALRGQLSLACKQLLLLLLLLSPPVARVAYTP